MFGAPINPIFAARPVLVARPIEDEVLAARRRFEALFNKESLCVYCGVKYLEQNNLGTLKCPVLEHMELWTGTVWSCCKKPYFHPGCVQCDHSSTIQIPVRWIGERNTITIPADQIDDIKTPSKFELIEPKNVTQLQPVLLAKITRNKIV